MLYDNLKQGIPGDIKNINTFILDGKKFRLVVMSLHIKE